MAEFEPFATFSGSTITCFGKLTNPISRILSEEEKALLTSPDTPYSLFASRARKRCMSRLKNYCNTINLARQVLKMKSIKPLRNHTFITLTLSSTQIHCDLILKRELLNHFIIDCSRNYGLVDYIWKAEIQKNGNLHFHLLTPNFIPHEELRANWNKIQDKLGYVQRSLNFKENKNPNSTDIHSLKKIKDVIAYTGKYMSKDGTGRPICGKSWGCSDRIQKLLPYRLYMGADVTEWYWEQVNSIDSKIYNHEWHSTAKLKVAPNLNSLPKESLDKLKSIISSNLAILQLR
ncbi:MAG: hypothetical protein RLZZ574_150 [Cyanobacteriota bacterium]|jgi:hypothetical protein